MWMLFLAWGLWVLVYGQIPVRSGIVKGKDARIIGLVFLLFAALELSMPSEYIRLFYAIEISALGVICFMVKVKPDGEK